MRTSLRIIFDKDKLTEEDIRIMKHIVNTQKASKIWILSNDAIEEIRWEDDVG